MKVLLTGAEGQLGRHLRASVPDSVELVTSSRSGGDQPCDLVNADSLARLLELVRPDLVINAAAWTAVDLAEDQPEAAYMLNAHVPASLSDWCSRHDAALITYSTDYVFDGLPGRAWRESDVTAPQSVYGRSKLEGERAVLASGARSVIIRTAWVYSALPGNFLSAILARAARGEALRVVSDQIGSPTWAGQLAEASWRVLGIVREQVKGPELLHVAGAGQMSWHEFAALAVSRAASIGLVPGPVAVEAISSDAWPQKARRPAWSVLDSSRFEQWVGQPSMTVERALEACLNQWKQAPC